MNNKIKLTILIILFILSIGIDIALFYFKIFDYLIVLGLFTIMIFISMILEIKKSNMDDNKKYLYLVDRTIKMYSPILVETKNFPELKNKSILEVGKIGDLINAQYEIKKPIYYIKSDDSTIFYILDNDVMLVYYIKIYEDVLTSLEIKLEKLYNLSRGKLKDLEII